MKRWLLLGVIAAAVAGVLVWREARWAYLFDDQEVGL